ncbi:MAG: hypothetical protein H7246_17490, partial [Phycisphaerae bacterium]|nr:hypothetical protein [Saprospiraceae bacterium]
HPFVHTPAYFIDNHIFPPSLTPELFSKLNSANYFTVYPPVCQVVFALATWVFPTSELGGVFVMKLFLLVCEIGTIRLLLRHTELAALTYALNPLVILEICGNCHFEGAMIFFLLAGISALQQGKIAKGALWWALATASKLLPIMFLPIVWRWLGWRNGWAFIAIFAMGCLVLFAPVLAVLPNILESLDLYFRQFQFNASIYYLVREIGFQKIGWDIGEISGPVLGGVMVLGVLIIAWRTRSLLVSELPDPENRDKLSRSLSTPLLFALFLYLSLSATVQPWYLTVPLALSCLMRWRFMIVWSGLVALSYSHYLGGGKQENYGLIALEYGLLWGFLLWELSRIFVKKAAPNSS